MAGRDKSPMEYMVDFFAGIAGYFAKLVEMVVVGVVKNEKKEQGKSLVDVDGQQVPKKVADNMAYKNMDIPRKWARQWSKKDLEKYEADWNKLTEEQKQKRRDEFYEKNIEAIKDAAEEYRKLTNQRLKNIDVYSVQDRSNQPIYLSRVMENMKKNNPDLYKLYQQSQQKQNQLNQNNPEQTNPQQQLNQSQPGQGFSGRRQNLGTQNQELNEEVNNLQGNKKDDLAKDEIKEDNIEVSKDQTKGDNQIRNQELEKDEQLIRELEEEERKEKLKEKVEEGAQKRKENAAQNIRGKRERELNNSDPLSNNQPMVPGNK